ncbi:restriction system modified-DNA reader domain-containing protein [Streptomyces zhihengii]
MGRVIRVDDEVYADLQSRAEPFVDTPNSVLRRLLGLSAHTDGEEVPRSGGTLAPLLDQGRLTVGDVLVWTRRNLRREHRAEVLANGDLRLEDGSVHSTPSGAASFLAGNQQNGWRAFATEAGVLLKDLR